MKSIVNWKNLPLLRIILPMIAGILISIYFHLSSNFWPFALATCMVLLVFQFFFIKSRPSLRKEIMFGAILYGLMFFVGVNVVIFKTSHHHPLHYQKVQEQHDDYIIDIVEIPKEKPNSIQVIAEVNYCINYAGRYKPSTGLILLYFQKDSISERLIQGDKILLHTNLQNISEPNNPGQFNYKQYLEFNQIYQQGFVKSTDFKKIKSGQYSLTKFASQCRDKLLSILKENGLENNELAVASALILGYKDDLADELKHSYSSAGATHVLAVSGLHVGIIFLVLSFMLNLLDKNDRWKISKAIFLICFLWLYATITGLSPSVIRAATMFSFVTFGKTFDRNSNIYNTLSSSAFVLLLLNPFLIMEVGFQLSYLAVLGIVYFQEKIFRLVYVKNKYLKYLWMITSVSIAAQLTTFPLGLLYFHQFPTYFFISNLLVIPGAMLIIGLGILLFIVHWIPWVGAMIAWLLSSFIYAMNTFIISIDTLPMSLIEGISISIFECWLIYFVLLIFVVGYESRRLKYIGFGLLGISLFLIIDLWEDYRHYKIYQIVCYKVKEEPNINFISANTNILVAQKSLTENKNQMLFNIHHHWFDLDLMNPSYYDLSNKIETKDVYGLNHFYQFKNKKIFHLTEQPNNNNEVDIDILYISSKENIDFEQTLTQFKPEYIVIDESCNWRTRQEITNYKYLNQIKVHNMKEDGAFVFTFAPY